MTNNFIWYELAATDKPAAEAFYASVVGWSLQNYGGGMDYAVLGAADGQVGGIGTPAPEAWARPGWSGYIGVEDVDRTAAHCREAGGTIVRAPADIPGVGRFAVIADPQGARFMLLRGSVPDHAAPQGFKANAPGHIGWNELHSSDWERAFAFYSVLFGWEKIQAMDMGEMGTYQLVGFGGEPIGAMFNSPNVAPSWLFYFNVDDIDAAHRRLTEQRGTILHGPAEVPGERWIVQASDPQGAMFALVGPRK